MSSVIRGVNRPKNTKTKTKNNRYTAFKTLPMKSKIWLCSKPYYNVYPRARFKSRLSSMVRVNVILNRTVVVNSDWRFDNRRGSHLQRQVTEVNNQSIIPANDVIQDKLPDRLLKRQSLATTTLLFRTTFTRTIKLDKNWCWNNLSTF